MLLVRVQGYGSKNRETRETREKNAQSPKLGTTRTGFPISNDKNSSPLRRRGWVRLSEDSRNPELLLLLRLCGVSRITVNADKVISCLCGYFGSGQDFT